MTDLRRGAQSEQPVEPPSAVIAGGDAALSAWLRTGTDVVRFLPDHTSDLARALGLGPSSAVGAPVLLKVDALDLGDRGLAVNAVVLGRSPDGLRAHHRAVGVRVAVDGRLVHRGRATSVVVANGEFLHGCGVVPRGHPGDGVFEVQVYALARRERAELRRRVALGTHLPHPGIVQARGHAVEIEADRPMALEVDGERRDRARAIAASIRPSIVHLVIGRPVDERA